MATRATKWLTGAGSWPNQPVLTRSSSRLTALACHSACNFDPPYCLICECYQGGGDGTLSAHEDVWLMGGPVGGSGPSWPEPSTGPGTGLAVVLGAVLARSFSAAVFRSAFSSRCTIECCLGPNVCGSRSARRPTIARAVSCGSAASQFPIVARCGSSLDGMRTRFL